MLVVPERLKFMNKIYKNEALFAEANKKMAAASLQLSPGNFPHDYELSLYCECANKACFDRIPVQLSAYIHRPDKITFFVKPQHYLPEFERIVREHEESWTIANRPDKLAKDFEI